MYSVQRNRSFIESQGVHGEKVMRREDEDEEQEEDYDHLWIDEGGEG